MYYVMSDIHGCYKQFNRALKYWDVDKEHLVIIGDSINKGPQSLKVIRRLMHLKEKYPDKVTITMGNHEATFIKWFEKNKESIVRNYSHKEFVKSFVGREKYETMDAEERMNYIIKNRRKEYEFIKKLPIYFETEHIIFAHAGINSYIENWKDDKEYMLWEKYDFIFNDKAPDKIVVFGHTPTNFIHEDSNNHNIWISKDGKKIAIDGRVSTGGQLNTVKLDNIGNIVSMSVFPRKRSENKVK